MIRIILAILLLTFTVIGLTTGIHPVYGVGAGLTALFLIGWYCVNRFDDNQFVPLK